MFGRLSAELEGSDLAAWAFAVKNHAMQTKPKQKARRVIVVSKATDIRQITIAVKSEVVANDLLSVARTQSLPNQIVHAVRDEMRAAVAGGEDDTTRVST